MRPRTTSVDEGKQRAIDRGELARRHAESAEHATSPRERLARRGDCKRVALRRGNRTHPHPGQRRQRDGVRLEADAAVVLWEVVH